MLGNVLINFDILTGNFIINLKFRRHVEIIIAKCQTWMLAKLIFYVLSILFFDILLN